jgi:hypothetical protein
MQTRDTRCGKSKTERRMRETETMNEREWTRERVGEWTSA